MPLPADALHKTRFMLFMRTSLHLSRRLVWLWNLSACLTRALMVLCSPAECADMDEEDELMLAAIEQYEAQQACRSGQAAPTRAARQTMIQLA